MLHVGLRVSVSRVWGVCTFVPVVGSGAWVSLGVCVSVCVCCMNHGMCVCVCVCYMLVSWGSMSLTCGLVNRRGVRVCMCVCGSAFPGLWLVTCSVCVCVYVSAFLCNLTSAGPVPQLSLFPHLKPCAPAQHREPPGFHLSTW